MFDFRNLDEIDDEGASPEWVKWNGRQAAWQRVERESPALLEAIWEEQFAAPDDEEEVYVHEKLEVPNLPENAFDPLDLVEDTVDAIEDKMASYNGQVILNYITGTYEDFLMQEREKEERKAYIDSLHRERTAILDSSTQQTSKGDTAQMLSLQMAKHFERKSFAWCEIITPLCTTSMSAPDWTSAECEISASSRTMRSLANVSGHCIMPSSVLIQMCCTMGAQARPMPSRVGRTGEWHLTLTDVFFPSCFLLDDGKEVLQNVAEGKGSPPSLVVCCVTAINKEVGAIEAKYILENIKVSTPNNLPRRRGLGV